MDIATCCFSKWVACVPDAHFSRQPSPEPFCWNHRLEAMDFRIFLPLVCHPVLHTVPLRALQAVGGEAAKTVSQAQQQADPGWL